MIPTTIKFKLMRLRLRERLLDLAWGFARLVALVIVLLFLACLLDWTIDREQDTPETLRRFLLYLQISVAVGAGLVFLVWPLRKRLTDTSLALRVEDKYPSLENRLISAVQLNRRGANTDGMSEELIGVVTREAVEQAKELDFSRVGDQGRLKRAAVVMLPALVLAVAPFLFWPETAAALLARQWGEDRDIPRNVTMEPIAVGPWPSGEKGVISFKVRGQDLANFKGTTLIQPPGLLAERYPLEVDASQPAGEGEVIVKAEVPPSTTDFVYSAWWGDGRTKKPAHVRYVPRPVVVEQAAWIQFPEFCGLRPDGSRYEEPQGRGDVQGILGSSARVVIKVQKPIQGGYLELLGPGKSEPASRTPQGAPGEDSSSRAPKSAATEETPPEVVLRTVRLEALRGRPEEDDTRLQIREVLEGFMGAFRHLPGFEHLALEPRAWQATFDLRPEESGYRIVVVDEYGFVNIPAPRRNLRVVPEEPPQVALLKEQFPPALRDFTVSTGDNDSSADDFIVEGLPLPPGGSVPVAYTASGPYGLGMARLLFRVMEKKESGNDEPVEEKWFTLPLQETAGSGETGPFDPRIGAFQNSGPRDQVYFHATLGGPRLPRTLGGGRFDFKTTGIPDGKGGLRSLKVGDQIEYCIEVCADKDGKPDRPSARSETRVKTVVSFSDLERWLTDSLQEAQRIRQLDAKQRGIFDGR
jgi:hypothetical protein